METGELTIVSVLFDVRKITESARKASTREHDRLERRLDELGNCLGSRLHVFEQIGRERAKALTPAAGASEPGPGLRAGIGRPAPA